MRIASTLAVLVVTAMDVWWNPPGTPEPDAISYTLIVLSGLALFVRHRAPLPALLLCAGVYTAWTIQGQRGELLLLPAAVALYTVAVRSGRRRTLVVGAAAVLWSSTLEWFVVDRSSAPGAAFAWPVVALLLGEVVRARRELQTRAAAERERDIARERVRIARDVHDVVAHVLAGVTVQMGVAVAAVDRDPAAARAALQQARTASRGALAELRTSVALLRHGGPTADGEPLPGLADLPALVDGVRPAGLDVRLDVDAGELPAVLGLTVYRIVQEALTNVVRHARATSAVVTVARGPDAVRVDVVDDGTGGSGGPPGFGILGMTERAAGVGGRLDAGPGPERGFRVRAVLPLPPGEEP
ncbi:sensor histidine kinase [Cryptosporangium arvum]|uniref:sensor histidine kinase n=1 Tax=Cryptosporangium arvum TaxID=80871 RepID=UPI0004B4B9B9|nr:histidine kinase [Cryptosporangium arvum]